MPEDWAAKCMNLLRRKVYSSAVLQFWIANHQALLDKYDFNNYAKLAEFWDKLPTAAILGAGR